MDLQFHTWTGRRVAVTGATGFIGYHLCRLLASLNANVTVLVRASSDASHVTAMGRRCRIAPLNDVTAIAEACRKAERELRYQPRPLSETIADTHEFRMVQREHQQRAAHAA